MVAVQACGARPNVLPVLVPVVRTLTSTHSACSLSLFRYEPHIAAATRVKYSLVCAGPLTLRGACTD